MLFLLRKIRRKLMQNLPTAVGNKFTTYLLYAIGEIVLVVIGILLAVQINNWNQERKTQDNIRNYLVNLYNETEGNAQLIEQAIARSNAVLSAGRELANLMAEDVSSSPETSKLLNDVFAPVLEYRPNLSVLNEMISSGAIRNLRNDSLKNKILGFQSKLTFLQIQENYHTRDYNACTDEILKYGSMRTVLDETGYSTGFLGIAKSKKARNYDQLLNSNEFDNKLLLFIASGTGLHETNYLPLLEYLEALLVSIQSEIDS